jgi:hypothetical protein
MLRLSIGPTATQTQIGVTLGLGIDEQIGFTGFLSGSAADWRLDGEVELISSDLLMSAIEARLANASDNARAAGCNYPV